MADTTSLTVLGCLTQSKEIRSLALTNGLIIICFFYGKTQEEKLAKEENRRLNLRSVVCTM